MKNRFKQILRQINNGVKYGFRRTQKIYPVDLFKSKGFLDQKHIFFLSTGRCGTMYFATLLDQFSSIKAFHEPPPTLAMQAQYAWNSHIENYRDSSEMLKMIFITARELIMHRTFEHGFCYAETNNFLTFFAPVLANLFPNAKFIHIVRHPGEFVRSAIRRKFYTGKHHYDNFRIKPLNNTIEYSLWDGYSKIQKNAWLWKATNQFIENFEHKIQKKRFQRFNFNTISKETIYEMFDFLELKTDLSYVKIDLKKKTNVQKTGDFPEFLEWNKTQKEELQEICSDLANKYGYNLT